MTTTEAIIQRLQTLPEAMRQEILDFVEFLESRRCGPAMREVDFWNPLDLDQLLQAQPGPPVADMTGLATSCWPEQESADEFIEYIYQQRREESLTA